MRPVGVAGRDGRGAGRDPGAGRGPLSTGTISTATRSRLAGTGSTPVSGFTGSASVLRGTSIVGTGSASALGGTSIVGTGSASALGGASTVPEPPVGTVLGTGSDEGSPSSPKVVADAGTVAGERPATFSA